MKLKFICTLMILSAFSPLSFAEDATKPDVRIVVDISGSMKNNDPNNLRIPAVKMLLGLLPDGSRAGVWTFGRYVNMLVPHKPVTQKWKTQARQSVKKINSAGQFTHIELALKKAGFDLDHNKKHKNTHVILLTDGQVDISKNAKLNKNSRNSIIQNLAKKYAKAGIKIHTVALSKQADHLLLKRISAATGGISTVADDADQLMNMFLQVFDQAAPQDQLPITGNVFQIDSSVKEATVLLFRKNSGQPTKLTDPKGRVWQSNKLSKKMKWFEDEKFDLITITNPIDGDWIIDASQHPDNRVSVISDLKLRVEGLPAVIAAGEPLTMSVFFLEKNRLLDDKAFLDLIDISIQIDRNGSKLGLARVTDFPMVKGKYKVKLRSLSKYASYAILIEADGKTFSRKFQRLFKIAPPLPDDPELDGDVFEQLAPDPEPIDIEPEVVIGELMEHPVISKVVSVGTADNPGYDVVLDVVDPTMTTEGTAVISMIASPDGRTFIGTVDTTSDTQWKMQFREEDLTAVGEYKIQFSFTGKQTSGKEFVYKPDALVITHQDDWVDPTPEPVEPIEAIVDEPLDYEEPLIDTIEEEPLIDQLETEPETVPEVDDEAAAEVEESWYTSGWFVGGLIALFNLLVIGGGYFAYRKLTQPDSEAQAPSDETKEPAAKAESSAEEPAAVATDDEEDEGILDQLFDEDSADSAASEGTDDLQDLLKAVDDELVAAEAPVQAAPVEKAPIEKPAVEPPAAESPEPVAEPAAPVAEPITKPAAEPVAEVVAAEPSPV
ncbi:MAG: VWA domain-containing protein [Pseudomonadales bacterium]|nr:VWA domain-containing protein [Pseudomonadales bacterium]